MADDSEVALDTEALLRVCAGGGDLIVLRAPHRTGKLFADELAAVAELHGLPTDLLVLLTTGLYLLLPSATARGRAELLASVDALGGVRLCGELVLAAADPRAFVAAVGGARARIRAAPRWRLAYEVNYPAAEMWVIPMTRCHDVASLMVGLHTALGADDFADAWPVDVADGGGGPAGGMKTTIRVEAEEAAAAVDSLIVLHCKHGLLLIRERRPCRDAPTTATDAAAS